MLNKINQQLEKIYSIVEGGDKFEKEISNWSVYKQLEHILITKKKVTKAIIEKQQVEEKKPRTFISYIVLTIGYLPRGKAKVPKIVEPKGVSQNELRNLLNDTKANLSKLDNIDYKNIDSVVENHPYFGGLNSKEWLRFLEVHTNHHLKIIRDIEKS